VYCIRKTCYVLLCPPLLTAPPTGEAAKLTDDVAYAVWGHAAQKVTIRKKLSSLQRLGLTAITFVSQGTQTMGMELFYDLPPLHLRIQECALGTFLRLGELQEVAWIPKSKT
jgi:hypothetical protein